MLAELVNSIKELAVKADGQRIVTPKSEPPHVYYTVDADGELEFREAELPPASHKAGTLQTLADLAIAAHLRALKPAPGFFPSVWLSANLVTGVIGERDRVSLPLGFSPQFLKLIEWNRSPAVLTQIEIVSLIRTLFVDCLSNHPDLKQLVSKVDIKKVQEAQGEITAGKVSISKSMLAEVGGANKLPEIVAFSVPIYESPNFPCQASIRCAFDLDPGTERFRFFVLPGEIHKATTKAEEYLTGVLQRCFDAVNDGEGVNIPIYNGTEK